ncbi:sensor histidine kinase [Sphaerisporangium perillae]|uniref:sensor histidine kinase n=1 Tax=Sphaerisporangium perillae TaxID=2935860 RepID=UPI00200E4CF6|nr:ATP-binding protein [Sphaerisporangium perillae]
MVRTRTALEALSRHPPSFLRSPWPWRSLAYLLSSALPGRGLAAAVREAAGRSPVPVEVEIDLPRRPPEAVETTAYYVVTEALANLARHSRASRARVHGLLDGDMLVVEIRDDGIGGADPARGTGLTGLADRVALMEGTLSMSSPPGGPTSIRAEIPCAW